MKKDLNLRNITTFDVERLLAAYRKRNQGEDIDEKSVLYVVVIHITAIRTKIATRQALSDGVDFKDEIDMMEKAAKENRKRGLLFAECAYGLRTLLSTNYTPKLDYQNLLSASLLLKRKDLMEMAVKCGADVTEAAPDDKTDGTFSVLPILMAVEDGNKSIIAWFCNNGAQAQLVQKSSEALAIAVKKNRLDLFKYLRDIGCSLDQDELQMMFSLCCKEGADNFHEYLYSIGAKPAKQDFEAAVKSGNLIMVKWFVETLLFNVNKDLPTNTNFIDPINNSKVMRYLHDRGMQYKTK